MTVGALTPHNRPITLVDYDPGWPAAFTRQAQRVHAVLGPAALRVEHVGSTAVPGLCAKPVIDMVLVVADSADESAYAPALRAAGYRLRIREPAWHEHRLFKGPDTDINLHVFSSGDTEVDRMLSFRDWLRTHETDRARYAEAKRALAGQVWRHVQDYADAKTATITEIMARAAGSLR